MSIIVTGGYVAVAGQPNVKAPVDQIIFEGQRVAGQVPINALGVLLVKNVPDVRNFQGGEVLNYLDSNRNNNAQLTIRSVVGPTKYNIQRTA